MEVQSDKDYALSSCRTAEIFFTATFSLPRKKLPFPALIFDGQLKTRQAPGTSFEPYLIPVLAEWQSLVLGQLLIPPVSESRAPDLPRPL
jgi:hypothetical protein